MITFKRFFISWETIFDEAKLRQEVNDAEREINEDSFWQNNENAQAIFNALSSKKKKLEHIQALKGLEEDILAFKDLFSTDSTTLEEESFVSEFEKSVLEFNKQVAELELKSLQKAEDFSKKIRENILNMAYSAGSSSAHIGGALSIADIRGY